MGVSIDAGSRGAPPREPRERVHNASEQVRKESLVLRNYDGAETHSLSDRRLDAADDIVFEREYVASADCLVGDGFSETVVSRLATAC